MSTVRSPNGAMQDVMHGAMNGDGNGALSGALNGIQQPSVPESQPALQWAVRHSELKVIQDAIRSTSSREAAARALGISPRTLRYKLAQMRDLGMMAV